MDYFLGWCLRCEKHIPHDCLYCSEACQFQDANDAQVSGHSPLSPVATVTCSLLTDDCIERATTPTEPSPKSTQASDIPTASPPLSFSFPKFQRRPSHVRRGRQVSSGI